MKKKLKDILIRIIKMEERLDIRKVTTEGEIMYIIYNKDGDHIGMIRKERNGRFMHWNLIIPLDLMETLVNRKQYLSFSPGCQDEIREFCRKLNGNKCRKERRREE